MRTTVTRVLYKDIQAIRMESEDLAVTIIPESGAKVQSIFDKKHNREVLFQSSRPEFRRAAYGDGFPAGDMSGFDEVFPTIDECYYPSGPWKGVWIPDHGEIWAVPWECEIEENSIRLSVTGTRFPFQMEKKVEFLRENCFRMSYRVKNFSGFDLHSIWCPHPFFLADVDAHVVLPTPVRQVISTCGLENKLGEYGSIHDWPVTQLADGSRYDISDVTNPPYAGKCEKFYTIQNPGEGWCALRNTRTGYTVGLSYPVEKLPYLGVWEGIVEGVYVAALEPVTGALDRLDVAMLAGKAGVVKAKSTDEWYLNITAGITDELTGISVDGVIRN